ncbi:MAG: cofactor-independent phosphoglycerate mutase [Gaiellales bacterium]|nr:MAG: cofactor-independent phosphoglycerate mutase [Gaiellales bacterium]
MKYIILIPDGAADLPRADLGGKTPLEAARTPNMDMLASKGSLGLVRTIPEGFSPGSDVANLCVLGYDPHAYYTGRAPLEAASIGIDLAGGQVAFRCNLVSVVNGVMNDFTAGHIGTREADQLIGSLQGALGDDETSFHTGLSYRHITVTRGRGLAAECTPPHDITGQTIADHLPQGEDSDYVRDLMDRSVAVLAGHPVNQARLKQGKAAADMIWLWGQGTAPSMPTLEESFGITGAVITAVDLVKGLGSYAGLEVVDVPGATGFLDTNFRGKAQYALEALERHDFVYIHVEAPDEASHMGDTAAKIKALEQIDGELLNPLLAGLESIGEYRLLVLPDHATPLETMTHSDSPVPFILYDTAMPAEGGGSFTEADAAAAGLMIGKGWELMGRFLSQ